jgi:hypothetical protein
MKLKWPSKVLLDSYCKLLAQIVGDRWTKTEYFTRDKGDGIMVKSNMQHVSALKQAKHWNYRHKESWINNDWPFGWDGIKGLSRV